MALSIAWAELIEVELTGKRLPRYGAIFRAYERRLDIGDGAQITYLCNAESARAVRTALTDLPAGRSIAPQVAIHEVYDAYGHWAGDVRPAWMLTARARATQEVATSRPERPDRAQSF